MPYGRKQYSRLTDEGVPQVMKDIKASLDALREDFPQIFERDDLMICYYERTAGQAPNSLYPEKLRNTGISPNNIEAAAKKIHKDWYHYNDIIMYGVCFNSNRGIVMVMAKAQSVIDCKAQNKPETG